MNTLTGNSIATGINKFLFTSPHSFTIGFR